MPEPDMVCAAEVLVEGSWFPVADLPRILGNFMRSAAEAHREAKESQAALTEMKPSPVPAGEVVERAGVWAEACYEARQHVEATQHTETECMIGKPVRTVANLRAVPAGEVVERADEDRRLRVATEAMLAYEGYQPDEIAALDEPLDHTRCAEPRDGDCTDESGEPCHPLHDHASVLAETYRVGLDALAAANLLAVPAGDGDREALADWLGALPESRNVFDYTDEATTVITINVEDLTDLLLARWRRGEPTAGETVEEWGAEDRYGMVTKNRSRGHAQRQAARFSQPARVVTRSVTTTPWVPVDDDQGGES